MAESAPTPGSISSAVAYPQDWHLHPGPVLRSPQLLDLPHETLFDICLHLDHQALANVTQACRALHAITNSEHFWKRLCAMLESGPGFQQSLFKSDQKKSFNDLQRYTRNMLRVHDGWLSPSPPNFRTRQVKSMLLWNNYELLPGSRWLFGVLIDGRVCILDLDAESATYHILLATSHPQDSVLTKFKIFVSEGNHSYFRVALYNTDCRDSKSTRICIYQIEQQIGGFQVTPLTVIWDLARSHFRGCVELSERYIVQCCYLLNGSNDDAPAVLQLRRYSNDSTVPRRYIEKQLADLGWAGAFFLPNDCLGLFRRSSVEIYSIHETSSTVMPDLVPLHCIPSNCNPIFSSRPFIGRYGTHLVGIHQNTVKRVSISHDVTVQPTVETLGALNLEPNYDTRHTKFGPLASVYCENMTKVDIATYNVSSFYFPKFRSFHLDLSDRYIGGRITAVAGLDDHNGRIVLEPFGRERGFVVMDIM
ncbi:hypothetical protein D9756_006236 [Leucocoprinus leucothites]|uniref:F-box domain-containing protein n=1 Tax=Leucocoprinus leucothites TaxID=201217 RepID=A0A8H5D2N2_9AGAR|nr:hypothetical protein D9756_006236 [Leucoagaricus leucothites]